MVLAVAAGVVIYAYTMGYLGGFGSPTQMGAIAVDSASIANDTDNNYVLSVYLRNIGKTTVTPQVAYVVDANTKTQQASAGAILSMPEGSSAKLYTFTFIATGTGTTNMTSGMTYNFKVVSADNTQISFPLKMP